MKGEIQRLWSTEAPEGNDESFTGQIDTEDNLC